MKNVLEICTRFTGLYEPENELTYLHNTQDIPHYKILWEDTGDDVDIISFEINIHSARSGRFNPVWVKMPLASQELARELVIRHLVEHPDLVEWDASWHKDALI